MMLTKRVAVRVPRRVRWAGSMVTVDNPYTGETVAEVDEVDEPRMLAQIDDATSAHDAWATTRVSDRLQLLSRFVESFEARSDAFARQVSMQMGKPLSQAQGEMKTTVARAKTMMAFAEDALADYHLDDRDGIQRKIAREPIGPVLLLCPWNYPMLCAINSLVPAIAAGNSVLVKMSDRTPLCADAFAECFDAAGAPSGLVQAFHASHDRVAQAISHPAISFVNFTGSVEGGRAVYGTVAKRFIDVGLELGGKDAAYVCEDADLEQAVAGVVDGAFYNAGQSCCGVERVYVHESVYSEFIDRAKALTEEYVLGDPLNSLTTMGPVAQKRQPDFLRDQVEQARSLGAQIVIGGQPCTDASGKGRFFQPTLAVDCTHEMSLMVEESFGPVVGVMSVASDEQAVDFMNDSPYGLTASIWTTDNARANELAPKLDVGTGLWFPRSAMFVPV
ncbi:hypothetical protein PBRA_007130 [Plasmodiophora brassicae]|uniref:Aldehyde dehydrogenase domain-containing protein n=1 Tax=Plasmodiophora brassicae TaxID=37360 RepID=A0A0G4IV71_PLABS|nr:hypothetical protein PBRA_007130 [Plasmodiophora brassicae]